ncbi:MAG: hypothetical protein ACRESR_05080 [Gammaproteobacteria bacterium]
MDTPTPNYARLEYNETTPFSSVAKLASRLLPPLRDDCGTVARSSRTSVTSRAGSQLQHYDEARRAISGLGRRENTGKDTILHHSPMTGEDASAFEASGSGRSKNIGRDVTLHHPPMPGNGASTRPIETEAALWDGPGGLPQPASNAATRTITLEIRIFTAASSRSTILQMYHFHVESGGKSAVRSTAKTPDAKAKIGHGADP